MPNFTLFFTVSMAILLLAACGTGEQASQNNAVQAATNALESENASDTEQVNVSEAPGADPVPPPDAVSHPDGYLPPTPASGPEPADNASDSKEPPPATEDEYIRNRQAGG